MDKEKKEVFKILGLGIFGLVFFTGLTLYSLAQAYVSWDACGEYYPDRQLKCFMSAKYRIDPK